MIVCVLLVSNSRGCCLAAPGDHEHEVVEPALPCYLRDQTWLCVYCWCQTPEGVVSPRRAITRAQPEWSPRGETTPDNTHTIMFDPDYSMITHLYCQNIQNNDATGHKKCCRKFTRSCSLILKLAIPVTGTTPQMALHVTAHILLAQVASHTGWQHCAAVLRSYFLVLIVVYKCRWNAFINKKESPLTIYVFLMRETFSNGCKWKGRP